MRYETRDRDTYYEELRAAVTAENWSLTVTGFRAAWASHTRDHPPRESPSARDRPDGSWVGTGDRHLDHDANADVNRGHDRIRETEETRITPAIRRIEADDPTRHLVGLDHRLKGPDRIKEKVAATMELQPSATAQSALSDVPDAIRYTFQYEDARYTAGVRADISRMRDSGFELMQLKNLWGEEQYRGINSRWLDPGSGQRFEVQFHTRISFEAKQLTHELYERLRDPTTLRDEVAVLRGYQREVAAAVQPPSGVSDLIDYRRGRS